MFGVQPHNICGDEAYLKRSQGGNLLRITRRIRLGIIQEHKCLIFGTVYEFRDMP